MSSVILTLLERPDTARGLLDASARLGVLLGGARVEALVVRVPPESTILPTEEVLTAERAARIRAREAERSARLRAAFEVWAGSLRTEGVRAVFDDVESLAGSAIRERGSRADVIVLPRPEGRDHAAAEQEIHAALFTTDRPVLVVPPAAPASFGRRVAIAWRDDPQATRAVLSALRWQVPPERILVLAGVREGQAPPPLPDILTEHGIAAELHVLPVGTGVFGADLLAKAHALGADLLVMGAYQHSPVREWILGGVTRFMLGNADLPVLMRH
jgi:nucleotide-binding universal stress UspA family protein